ncbi:MAG: hypothetical protein DRR42_20805 [Gammaproteobacteria bacterium]|nr:MAG: hypothetical protein DRR42_20805 [Gammaproteobacteria bacterium]
METVNQILSWLNANETALSALAALVVIVGVTLSPLGAGVRGVLSRRQSHSPAQESVSNSKQSLPTAKLSESAGGQNKPAGQAGQSKDRPVVAVLPLNNMSADEEQGYLAEGMTEDIITALARSADIDVIARNSTFVYKGTTPDIRQVGKDLGARYVVEGSLRKVGERVRVTVQLIEAATGSHVWAENYDRPLSDIFAIQDEVSSGIASALGYAITVAEIDAANRASTDNLDAWGLVARSLSAAFQFNQETSAESVDFARQAVALDPCYAAAHARLASALVRRPINNFSENPEQDLNEAKASIERAMQLAPNDAGVLAEYGHVLCFSGRSDEAVPVLARALALCPSNAIAVAHYGYALGMTGQYDEGQNELARSTRLLPNAQYLYRIYFWRGTLFLITRDFAKAEENVRQSISIFKGFHTAWFSLASCLVLQGKTGEALAAIVEILQLMPDISAKKYRQNLSILFPSGTPDAMLEGIAALEEIWPKD